MSYWNGTSIEKSSANAFCWQGQRSELIDKIAPKNTGCKAHDSVEEKRKAILTDHTTSRFALPLSTAADDAKTARIQGRRLIG